MSNVESIKKAIDFYAEYFEDEVLGDLARNAIPSLEALQRENETLKQHVEELQEKIDPEKDCACSYDEAGAVCAAHSPMLKAAEAEVKRLREALTELVSCHDDFNASSGNMEEAYYKLAKYAYPKWEAARTALASAGEEHHAE